MLLPRPAKPSPGKWQFLANPLSSSFLPQVTILFFSLVPLFLLLSHPPFLSALPRAPSLGPEDRGRPGTPGPPPSASPPPEAQPQMQAPPALFPILKTSSCHTNCHQQGVQAELTPLLPPRRGQRPRRGGFQERNE